MGIVHDEKSSGYVTASKSSELEYSNWQETVNTETAATSCTRMGYLGYWESYSCDEKLYFICESDEYIERSSFGTSWKTRSKSYMYDGHYYRTVSLKATYDVAQKKCKKAGVYLVELNSGSENSYVHDKMRELYHDEWYFIGGSDTKQEGYFVWSDNQALTFENWWPGEPNDKYYEDCIEMRYQGKWNDVHCRQFKRYICEKAISDSG
ncbi:macrophage mannose receptor 1-like [Mytilus trossulus]|uniref:macrophage mannose receptor 1-like n=1 Tax=Mytilus trossulus TaxID=6551 RepID=UPI003004DAFD